MLKRKLKNKVQVTFTLPVQEGDESAYLVGDFNDWDVHATRMDRIDEGSWEAKVSLRPDREYQYRYLVNGTLWRTDPAADDYMRNPYGSENSVVSTFLESPIKRGGSRKAKSN